jgi:MFS superfamily sulfate permease-like transporter
MFHFFLQYGLYSSFMGCFMYVIFGTSKDIAVGPAAILAFITAEHASKGGFQLEFVSISRVINHMTCYNSSALIGGKFI